MTKLHFNYKDVFRALRLGFSAKKVWMMFLGLLVGFVGYSLLTYLAYIVSGNDFLTVWENFRLLPFPQPSFYPFPWFAWIIYAIGIIFSLCSVLIAGSAVSKVVYEQLRGDEFYESKEAFRFAFKHISSTLVSPLLIIGFVALIVVAGLILSLLGAIPYFGEIFVALMALPAFAASLFIVYLLIVLLFSLLIGPSIVGTTKNDTFDTIFEVFSCVNEQPARLVWYLVIVAFLTKFGSFLLGLASSAAGRIGYFVLKIFMGTKMVDVMSNAAFYFKVHLPGWWPEPLRASFMFCTKAFGLPQIYMPSEYTSVNWGVDVGALLVGICFYIVALVVMAYGLSVWYSGNTLAYAVLAKKKDDKNILETPEDEEELIEPVVPKPKPEAKPPTGETEEIEKTKEG
ncbi:hypothetical protein CH330_02665 [candidate division WOR-3 bacterium JGI_Cruoil_03_51_56]|uniref:Uncharacterized protein n=1 Tax=candidate division WOR-3 bacterium JGI_Cruoil_03_51_56 TaxID=1973747 RepID=A0A235BVR4_UNCW3|nr:MAG: hypothetical protein CH330_02665 [candidate division WOR-3 bacterium JGI_Cruoil_03_51_56]